MNKIGKTLLVAAFAAGLLGLGAASVHADPQPGAWTFVGAGNSFTHAGETIVWYVDFPNVTPADVTIASHITNGFWFAAEQQCWSGALLAGPWRFAVGSAGSVNSQTPVCSSGAGGTAVGRGWIWD